MLRRLSLLLIPSLALASAPEHGLPGHVRVELRTPQGWVELARPAFDLQQSTQTFSAPAPAGQALLRLRLSAPDNDETQVDWLDLDGGRLVDAAAGGQDARLKMAALDHDVAEIHGAPLLLTLAAPRDGKPLRFHLAARPSNNASIPKRPFHLGAGNLVGAQAGAGGPIRLDAVEGAEARIDTGRIQSGSGHPAAAILARLKVRDGRLQGRLDFGPDNDPGDDDYAAIVA